MPLLCGWLSWSVSWQWTPILTFSKIYLFLLLDPLVAGGGAGLDGLLGLPGLDGLALLPPTIWRSASRRREARGSTSQAALAQNRSLQLFRSTFTLSHTSRCKFSQSSQQMASHWLPLFCMSFSPVCQMLILKSGNCQFGRKQESSTDQFVATVNFF